MLAVDVSDTICPPYLSTKYLWLFFVIKGEQQELYFWTCNESMADQKLAESTYMICIFELKFLMLVSPCVNEPKLSQNWANDSGNSACYYGKPA